MPLLCICHSAPCAAALIALKRNGGKTCGMKRRTWETSLAYPLHLHVWVRGSRGVYLWEFLYVLNVRVCVLSTLKMLLDVFETRQTQPVLFATCTLCVTAECVFIFRVAICQFLLASVRVLSGRWCQACWIQCAPQLMWVTPVLG